MNFPYDLQTLCAKLDPERHAHELAALRSCRSLAQLAALAERDGGWLTPPRRGPRLKLVRHGTGTYLVVQYDDGWSTTISQAPFRTR